MAVAAVIGGASPNFDDLYNEVTRLSGKLSNASPRELNDPGQTLKFTIVDTANNTSQDYDLFMKPYYDKKGDPVNYELYYKDSNNQEIKITTMTTDPITKKLTQQLFNQVIPASTQYKVNGQIVNTNDQLVVDTDSGRIVYNATSGLYDPKNVAGTNEPLGTVKLDGATGLDVGLINDRISQVNLAIEALNKVLIVGSGNVQTAVDLRL